MATFPLERGLKKSDNDAMSNNKSQQPRAVPQVMVSSTFNDLREHRAAMIQAIHDHKLHANVMEHQGAKPWLLILDGLERVLVAYHRIDAAEMPDEDANSPTDKIVDCSPCDAIRDEDNDLLRALAAAAPSKILVSSRLTPRVLLNPSGQPIPGAKRITLDGLRLSNAEQLLHSCGIEGNSAAIQRQERPHLRRHERNTPKALNNIVSEPSKRQP